MKTISVLNGRIKKWSIAAAILSPAFFIFCNIKPVRTDQTPLKALPDSSVSFELKKIVTHGTGFYYPASVERFYSQNGYKLAWVMPDTAKSHSWEAMLLLDCVMQFGLNHADNHPRELQYKQLHFLTEQFNKATNVEKATFDALLTDAMIAFMNNLHYGKLNPNYPAYKIDEGNSGDMRAEQILAAALTEKDLMAKIISVQPMSAAYKSLRYQTYLLTGLYTGDCYETPEGDIRKIAVNMERLRWAGADEPYSVNINIPSYTLTLKEPDTAYKFKVIVGKPANPTPTLESAIAYFTTAPEWKVPKKIFVNELLPKAIKDNNFLETNHFAIYSNKGKYVEPNAGALLMVSRNAGEYYARQSSGCDNSLGAVVFRFPNIYDVYLHDTPEQKLFAKTDRALSHGCIRVENAATLAGMLLQRDGKSELIPEVNRAIKRYQTKTFKLKQPVPIKVTYLTCEVVDGYLTFYDDVYQLDKQLEMALYNMGQPLTLK